MPTDNTPNETKTPIWMSVSESAKIAGIGAKTIRRAIKKAGLLRYKIVKNRYQIELGSLLKFVMSKVKLRNKFEQSGIGQYFQSQKEDL